MFVNKFQLATLAIAIAALAASVSNAAIYDTFDSIDAAWVTDRYEPDEFVSDFFDGDNRLKIGISTDDSAANRPPAFNSTFYNTQGRSRPAGIAAPWTVSADLFVDASFDTTTGDLRRTDLWGRDDNPVEASANYPIFGITNNSPTDALNPSAGDRAVRFQIWDSQIGWVPLGLPGGFQFDAWHNLEITGTGTSFEYRLDGNLLHTDVTGSALGSEGLKSVYLQAYNFGDSSYAVHWDNLTAVAVPEPATLAICGLAAACVAGLRRRRK